MLLILKMNFLQKITIYFAIAVCKVVKVLFLIN